MKLLTEELKQQIPPLYSGEGKKLEDAIAVVKFFTPDGGWTWYATEGSPVDENGYYDTDKPKVDYIFFGLVDGFTSEFGYFSLAELERIRGVLGLPVERDLYWKPTRIRDILVHAEAA